MATVSQLNQDNVTELYLAFFNRAPDATGFGYWTNQLANGKTPAQVAQIFAKTPEFIANYDGLTPTQQVTKIYLNVLNRAPDASGLAYWVGQLTSGTQNIADVAWNVVNSAFTQVGTSDGLLVQNKVSVGEFFAITLASNDGAVAATAYTNVTSLASSVVAADAALAQAVAPTYTLTTAIETVPASGTLPLNAKVNGVATGNNGSTFQTGDTINGTANGANTLNITDAGAVGANVVATVNNVANIQHQLLASNTYDESLYTGVATEGFTNGAANAQLTILNGQLATVYGATNSTANSSTLSVGIRAGDRSGTADTLNFAVSNAGASISNGTGVPPTTNTVTLTSSSNGIETVAVATAGTNVIDVRATVGAGSTTDATSLKVTGAGNNTIAAGTFSTNAATYDLSGASGTNTLNLAGALTTNNTITGGTGADTLSVAQVTTAANVTVSGVETLRLSTTDASNGLIQFRSAANFTTVRVDGDLGESGTKTLNNIGTLSNITYVGDALTANSATAQQFDNLTINTSMSGSADTVAVTVSNGGVTTTGGYTLRTLTPNGAETLGVTVNDIGTAATATFTGITDNTLSSLTLTSAGSVALGTVNAATAAGTSGSLSLLDFTAVTGTAGSSATLANNTVGTSTVVNAVTGTAGTTLAIVGNEAATDSLIYTGGSGIDRINASSLSNASNGSTFLGTLVVSTGSGNDIVRAGSGADSITLGAGTDSVTGNDGADTIILTETVGAADTVLFGGSAFVTATNQSGGAYVIAADTVTGFGATDLLGFNSGFITASAGGSLGFTSAAFGSVGSAGGLTSNNAQQIVVVSNDVAGASGSAAIATLASAFASAASEAAIIVADDGTNAYVWYVNDSLDGTATTVTSTDLVLLGTLNGVNVAGFTSANFTAAVNS